MKKIKLYDYTRTQVFLKSKLKLMIKHYFGRSKSKSKLINLRFPNKTCEKLKIVFMQKCKILYMMARDNKIREGNLEKVPFPDILLHL